ncbi:MAG: hypothetical protein AMXMBFR23_21640 [Chloroflexota bacterium]
MGKSVGFAYSIAGAAVAAAVIVIAGSTVGFDRGEASPATEALAAQAAADPAAIDAALAAGVARSEIVQSANGEQVEYVYMDAPTSRGHDDDDDDHEEGEEHEEHEEREHREHEDHDDDD